MSTNNIFDLTKLYKTYFNQAPYFVSKDENSSPQQSSYVVTTENPRPKGSIDYSSKNIAFNDIGSYGQDIWFPVTFKTLFKGQRIELKLTACTVGVTMMKEIIRTPVAERNGKVKECFAIDDTRFNIKGFLIGKDRLVPEDQITQLKNIFETTESVEMHGGYHEIFLDDSCQVAVSSLEFPEVQGKAVWIRPFTMTVETDYIQDLF